MKTEINSSVLKIDFQQKIYEILKEIISLDENKKAVTDFFAVFKNVGIKDCDTRFGWKAGVALSITCKFTKRGNNEPLYELVKGLEGKADFFSFLCGLDPEVFLFNPISVYQDDENLFLMLKLVRRGKIDDM